MFFGWFDAREARQRGLILAKMVVEGLPASERKKANKAALQRAKLLDQIFAQARQYKNELKPNIYQRATFGNAFRWELLEQKCDLEFVEELTHQLLLQMK